MTDDRQLGLNVAPGGFLGRHKVEYTGSVDQRKRLAQRMSEDSDPIASGWGAGDRYLYWNGGDNTTKPDGTTPKYPNHLALDDQKRYLNSLPDPNQKRWIKKGGQRPGLTTPPGTVSPLAPGPGGGFAPPRGGGYGGAAGFIPNFVSRTDGSLSPDQLTALEEYEKLTPTSGQVNLDEISQAPVGSIGARVWGAIQAGSIDQDLKDFIKDKISGANKKQFIAIGGTSGAWWQSQQPGSSLGYRNGNLFGASNPRLAMAMNLHRLGRENVLGNLGPGGRRAGGRWQPNQELARMGRNQDPRNFREQNLFPNQSQMGFADQNFGGLQNSNAYFGAIGMRRPSEEWRPRQGQRRTPDLTNFRGFSLGAAGGHVPNFNMSSVIEKASARSLGYNPGVVKPITLNGAKAVYNTAETVRHMPGFSAPFINPPQHSQAGINHRASAIAQTGVNPYKAEGHVPNFIGTGADMTSMISQITRPEGAAQAIEIPGVMSLNSSVQTLQQAARLMATSLSGLKEQMANLAGQVGGLVSTGLRVQEGTVTVENKHTHDHGTMAVNHHHEGKVSVDNTDINNIIDNKLHAGSTQLPAEERANQVFQTGKG
jgi:hypothetical protein